MATLGRDVTASQQDLAVVLSIPVRSVNAILKTFVEREWINKVDKGKYTLTNKGISQIVNELKVSKPKRMSIRNLKAEEVRVWTIDDVLKYIVEKNAPVTSREICDRLFLTSIYDSYQRLRKLLKWNLIKKGKWIINEKGPKTRTYVATNWGREYWEGKKEERRKAKAIESEAH